MKTSRQFMQISLLTLASLSISGLLLGCGGQTDCSTQPVLSIGPASATASHSAKAPGNSAQFQATDSLELVHPQNSCSPPILHEMVRANWTVSDPNTATISSAPDATNGLATCLAASSTPVTLTATDSGETGPLTATATLICQ